MTAEVTHNRPQAAPLTWQEQEQSNAAVNTPRPTRRVGGPKQSPVRARRLAIAVWTAASYLASRTPIALERTPFDFALTVFADLINVVRIAIVARAAPARA